MFWVNHGEKLERKSVNEFWYMVHLFYSESTTCCGSHLALVGYVIFFFNVMIDVVTVIESRYVRGKWEVKSLQPVGLSNFPTGQNNMLQ